MANRPTRSRRQVSSSQQPESQSRAKWNAHLTNILVELMVEQARVGNKQNKFFNKEAWKFICDEFHKETGLPWDQEQLRSRYTALRKHYAIVRSILDQSDFKWDESTGAIIATSEAWDAYIKEHPDAEILRSTGCPTYMQLRTIFAETNNKTKGKPNGSATATGKERPIASQPSAVLDDKLSSSGSEEEVDVADEDEKPHPTNTSAKTTSKKKGRKGFDDFIAKAISEMAAASRLRADAINKYNDKYTIADCVRALDELQGVDDQVYLAALELFDRRISREIFLSLQPEKRLTWLHCKVSSAMEAVWPTPSSL